MEHAISRASWFKNSDFRARAPASLVLAGDWNGFKKALRLRRPGNRRWSAPLPIRHRTHLTGSQIRYAASWWNTTPGLHSFTFIANRVILSMGEARQHRRHNICSGIFRHVIGPYDSISFDNGYYYSFRVIDHMNAFPTHLRQS